MLEDKALNLIVARAVATTVNEVSSPYTGFVDGLLKNERHALYYCRTPLQSLIIQEIILRLPGRSTVIYHPTGSSTKHRFYFDRLACTTKAFVPWKYLEFSDTLSDVVAWWAIPRQIRGQCYSDLFISSIGSIPFSMFVARNRGATVNTFDDGTFNINPNVFPQFIRQEPRLRRWAKAFVNGVTNLGIIKRGNCHYTIFRTDDVVGIPYQIEEITLFGQKSEVGATLSKGARKVRVLLGTVFLQPHQRSFYEALITSGKFDVFLPHPAEGREAIVRPWVQKICTKLDLQNMIAEEIVLELTRTLLNPKVYGFNSTALFTLAKLVDTVSLQVLELHVELPTALLQKMGVRILRVAAAVAPDRRT